MSISVGGYVFNTRTTVVREQYEQVGGKQTRAIRVTGLLRGAADEAGLIAALDGVTLAVSADAPVAVSLRPGRRMLARREGFVREVNGAHAYGTVCAGPARRNGVGGVGDAARGAVDHRAVGRRPLDVVNQGNANAAPVIALTAEDVLITPAVSDGVRTLTYGGNVDSGSTLVFDGEAREARLDGALVTGYTSGEFPLLAPGETTLTYTDDPGSSHLVTGSVTHRDRWW